MNLLHDLDWVVALRTPMLTNLAFGLSWLGYSTFIMFFMAIGYWAWDKRIFYRVMILVCINATLNAYAKDFFQDPRPPLALRLDDLVGESYGMPSGHAQLAVVIWMWLAYEIRRTWVWIACAMIALGVILSRLYLGVHDIEDVLVGSMLGAASLIAFAMVKDNKWRWQTDPVWGAVVIVMVTGIVIASWPGTAPEYVPNLAGWLLGASFALQYEERHLGFTAAKVLWRRAAAGVIGAVGFIILHKALKFAALELGLPALVSQSLQGLVTGAFIALAVPWFLGKLQLVALGGETTSSPLPAVSGAR